MPVYRHTFNGGEIAPELHWRSDLARYGTSCRTLENMLPTPYGGATRRAGTKVLAHVYEPSRATVALRTLVFKYSEDTAYLIVFCDDDGDLSLQIYATDGTLKDTIADAPWAGLDLYKIAVSQTNDVMWLAHPEVPVYRLARHADDDWSLSAHIFTGGPWRPMNLERSATISVSPAVWNSGTAYAEGDRVLVGDTQQTLTSIAWVYGYQTRYTHPGWAGTVEIRNHYYTKFGMADASAFATGDTIIITGTTYHNGTWTVVAVDTGTDYVLLDCGVYYNVYSSWVNKHSEALTGSPVITKAVAGFYESILAGTNKAPASNPTYWRSCLAYSGTVTLKSEQSLFSTDMVNGAIRFEIETPEQSSVGTFAATDAASTPIPAYGTVRLTTEGGRWGGTIELRQSTDGGANWDVLGQICSHDADYNGSIERDIDQGGTLVRAYMKEYIAPTNNPTGCSWKLELVTRTSPTWVRITAYTDTYTVTATTESFLFAAAQTWRWAEGAFSPLNGYPRAVCIFDERLIVAGTTRDPQTVWGSEINDWENFAPGNLETSPIVFSVSADHLQTIQWLIPKQELMIGTDGGEWTMGGRDAEKAISGSNIKVRRHSEIGSAPIQAVATQEAVLYVQRGRQAVRSIEYSYELDGYQAPDVSILAHHVTAGGIRELAYQRVPYATLWAVRDDGVLVSFTYEKQHLVAGWARHDTYGQGFVSVAVVPGEDGDEVFVLTERNGHVFLEVLDTGGEYEDEVPATQPWTSCLDWRHTAADNGGVTEVILTQSISTIRAQLVAYGDGRRLDTDEYAIAYDAVEEAYVLTTVDEFYRIDVGIPFVSLVKPTDPTQGPETGIGPGDTFRVSEMALYLVDSVGAQVSADDGTTWQDVPWSTTAVVLGEALPPETGRYKAKITAGHTTGCNVAVRNSGPGPLTLAALEVGIQKTSD